MKKDINTRALNKRYRKNGMLKNFQDYFLRRIPGNRAVAEELKLSEHEIQMSYLFDRFSFHYRHYLIGIHTTLHRPLQELKRMIRCDQELAVEMVLFEINEVDKIIDQFEFYELLARMYYAEIKINEKLNPHKPWMKKNSIMR